MSRSPALMAILAAATASLLAAAPLAPVQGGGLLAQAPDRPAAPGRIVGRIVDKSTGQGLSDVGIQVVGATGGTMSGVDGRYTLAKVRPGTVTLHVRRLGYQPKTVTGILLAEGASIEQDITLEPATVRLQAVEVSAAAERGTVTEALDQQRTATGIVSAVTAEQMAKSPDADAAQAVQRVSGVTVQDGKYIFVRGLGERYTTTSLNGARLPSPEPEKKVVPLDLFPSALLQSITTSKTFTPDQPGDFSGASVDIRMREFPARRTVTYSTSVGYNTAATGRPVLAAPTTGREWLGFAGSERELPSAVRAASGLLGSIDQEQTNGLLRTFRNAWSARQTDASPNYSMSASVGGEDPLFGHRVGYLASTTYSYGHETRRGEVRSQSVCVSDASAGGCRVEPFNRLDGSTGRTSVLWGALLNLSAWAGGSSRIGLNNTYTRTADNEAFRGRGVVGGEIGFETEATTLRFVERSVRSHQLRGEHVLPGRQGLDWSLTYAAVSRSEPDRSDVLYGREPDVATGDPLPWAYLGSSSRGARRVFSDVRENALTASLNHRIELGGADRAAQLKVGAYLRAVDRDAETLVYAVQADLSQEQREASPEQIFDGRYTQSGDAFFRIIPPSTGVGPYDARDRIAAGYAMVERPVTDRVRVVAGARVERADLRVNAFPSGGLPAAGELVTTDVLPSAIVNVRLTGAQSLRLSASRTLARPEYREMAPVTFDEVFLDRPVSGNAALERSLIENYDARWEWYPNAGEVLSAALFAKRFRHPIEPVEVARTGATELTYVNARAAENYGAELELRKGLGFVARRLAQLTIFSNVTVMRSEVRLGSEAGILSNPDRPMVGQAPYVVNGGLGYASAGGRASATVLYNIVGRRIVAAGTEGAPDVYERPRHVVDLSLQLPLVRDLSARLDAKNVLDEPFLVTQGGVTRERYTAGRVISVGLAWRPQPGAAATR